MRKQILIGCMVAMAVSLALAGCKQKTQTAAAATPAGAATAPTPVIADGGGSKDKDACTDCADKSTKPTDGKTGATADAGNKTCPVMKGRAVNPNLYVEYKGKKVYLCCTKCVKMFKDDPEKYAANL